MRLIIPAAIIRVMLPQIATADAVTLICENPRREYRVVYDMAFGTVFADDTQYRVLAIEDTTDRLVVVGLTANDGPTFRLHIRPYKKMELFAGNQLFQTDGCR